MLKEHIYIYFLFEAKQVKTQQSDHDPVRVQRDGGHFDFVPRIQSNWGDAPTLSELGLNYLAALSNSFSKQLRCNAAALRGFCVIRKSSTKKSKTMTGRGWTGEENPDQNGTLKAEGVTRFHGETWLTAIFGIERGPFDLITHSGYFKASEIEQKSKNLFPGKILATSTWYVTTATCGVRHKTTRLTSYADLD